MTTMNRVRNNVSSGLPGCVKQADLFQHPLLEDEAKSVEDRRVRASLQRQAAAICATCPMRSSCLYDAVVNHDVAGIAGGTTPQERALIRRTLGVKVTPESLDAWVGTTSSGQVDHDEVIRLRQTNPTMTLEQIAERVGCSLSSVKRHLRKARAAAPRPRLASVKPTVDQVAAVAASLRPTNVVSNRRAA